MSLFPFPFTPLFLNRKMRILALVAITVLLAFTVEGIGAIPKRSFPRIKSGDLDTTFLNFLLLNRLPSGMPKSYAVEPMDYFQKVPSSEKLHYYNHSYWSPQCGQNVSATNMNAYMFQTEELLTHLGLDIYDGAMWTIALSVLGMVHEADNYTNNVIVQHKTAQFTDIRGDHACKGVMAWNQCTDPSQSGVCGFCYGLNATSLTVKNAYIFRMISDYWDIQGTLDARCPQTGMNWIWNDYRPILGENAWAQLTGPAHVAMIKANNTPSNIPDDAPIFAIGIPFLDALETMVAGNTGAIFYAPWNTWFGFSHASMDIAESFSIENQGSTYAGLRALYQLINNRSSSTHKQHLPRIKKLMAGIQKILLQSWNGEYFRQGGTYNHTNGELKWHQGGSPDFAVDCQTWVSTVLGVAVVDGAFGNLTSYKLWQTVKARAGYYSGGYLYGVGYTDNSYAGQVFSGEWTYGAINWLQVMIAEGGYNSTIVADLNTDIQNMLFGLETDLYTITRIHNSTEKHNAVMYSNKRYYIPFGWFANDIPAMCSTAWAVCVDNNFNPFNVQGGAYAYSDEFVHMMVKKVGSDWQIKEEVLQQISDMENHYKSVVQMN
jgi:hypothetical protein